MSRGDGLDAETREPPNEEQRPTAARKLALTILHHANPERVGERASFDRPELELSRRTPDFAPPHGGDPQPLLDLFVSRTGTSISVEGALARFRRPNGASALEVNGALVGEELNVPSELLEPGIVLLLGRRCVLLLHWSFDQGARGEDDLGLIGESAAMHRVRREIKKLAPLNIPVLIRGATGSGKELVAQAIHRSGPRAPAPFVAVNVATLAPAVAVSELFGHKKGSFTGAIADHPGHFGRADSGTLFLDEIGETSLEVQAYLLRILETSVVQPLGGGSDRTVDVRLLTATDADLEGAVARGTFREPLLHRLSGFVLRLPRLAERREDLGRLLVHFMAKEAHALGVELDTKNEDHPWLAAETVAKLALYDWPGNVRQLRNIARQLLVARDEGPDAIAEVLSALAPRTNTATNRTLSMRRPAGVRDEEIISVLEKNEWKVERAAQELGISRTSLYRKIEKIPDLKKSKDLGEPQIDAALAETGGDLANAARMLRVSEAGLRLRLSELGKLRR